MTAFFHWINNSAVRWWIWWSKMSTIFCTHKLLKPGLKFRILNKSINSSEDWGIANSLWTLVNSHRTLFLHASLQSTAWNFWKSTFNLPETLNTYKETKMRQITRGRENSLGSVWSIWTLVINSQKPASQTWTLGKDSTGEFQNV